VKSVLLYGIMIFCLALKSQAQNYGSIALPMGMIREDRNMVDRDSIASKRSIIEQPISIFPNPATDYVWIVITSDYPTYYSALIYDINGMPLLRKYWLTEAGTNKYYLPLPQGGEPLPLYIRINGPWTVSARIFRIVKQI
jgi:hypothetical protein